jgi:hypothetical protein
MIARTVLVCIFSTQKHSPSMNNESEAFITLIKMEKNSEITYKLAVWKG